MEGSIKNNYHFIFTNVMTYLPSRLLIILNSVIIIPIFTYFLDEKQMSIYLIALQVLNLMCTCSFDWITKAVLRFYEKYNIRNTLNLFFSSIFWLSVIVYIIIFISYFTFKDLILEKFAVDNTSFLYTILLVLPCGIRQFLYQILRARNEAKLYTLSILLYQLAFILLFFAITKIIPDAHGVLLAMIIAIVAIDIHIIRSIFLDYKIENKINKEILFEILKYGLPLIITNTSYWAILNYSKLIFQNWHEYLNTAITGVSWMLSGNIIQPLVTVFTFASFPVIVKKFELKRLHKPYFTNILQLYCFLLIPIVSVFCYFSKEIVSLILPENYYMVSYMLPFFAFGIFLHEFMKLINIKYHLKNRTYIEMLLGIFIASMAYFANIKLISAYSILGAAIGLFGSEVILVFVNLFVKFRSFDYLNYNKILKTFFLISFSGLIIWGAIQLLFIPFRMNNIASIAKILIFISMYYLVCFKFRDKILS